MKKYFLMQFYSFIDNCKNYCEVLIRSLFFLVIIYIFAKLWGVTDVHQKLMHKESMIWYLAVTETIVLSLPIIQFEIESDIRSGDVVYQLTKPVNYLWLKIFEHVGAFCFRYILFLILGFFYCIYLSDGFMPPINKLICAYIAAFFAGIVMIFFHASIGITAFKLQDCSPLFWIWQRSTFLFGGLLIPIDFYPYYLKYIANILPFSSLIYAPAHLVMESNIIIFFDCMVRIVLWGIIALLSSRWLYSIALKHMKVNGG